MLHVGIPQKIVTRVKKIYEDTKCTLQIGRQLTDIYIYICIYIYIYMYIYIYIYI